MLTTIARTEVFMKKTYHNKIFERISREKQQRLIDTAIHEFAHRGFDSANINTIASKAGMSVGAVYKYFSTKKDLFLACVHFGVETLEDVLNDILVSKDDIFTKIEKIIKIIQSHSSSHKDLIILYNEMTSESNSELTWEIASRMETISSKVYSFLISQAQEEGTVTKDIPAKMLAFFLDNLFMMLQFSYACDYYRERFKIYAGSDIFEDNDFVAGEMMKFIRAAFEQPSGKSNREG